MLIIACSGAQEAAMRAIEKCPECDATPSVSDEKLIASPLLVLCYRHRQIFQRWMREEGRHERGVCTYSGRESAA